MGFQVLLPLKNIGNYPNNDISLLTFKAKPMPFPSYNTVRLLSANECKLQLKVRIQRILVAKGLVTHDEHASSYNHLSIVINNNNISLNIFH